MRRIAIIVAAGLLFAAHAVLVGRATDAWNGLPRTDSIGNMMSGPLLKVLSLEFDGVVADYLFMNTMAFLGSKLEKDRFAMTPEEWNSVDRMLTVSAELDPYFIDPYFIANAYLTWDAGMVHEANALLERGIQYRSWDWTLPFFVGFNNFFFLHDNARASEYLFLASRRPDASPMLASLAAKLAYQEHETENAIAFLEAMLQQTEDEGQRKLFEVRLEALKTRLVLDQALEGYRRKYKRMPSRLEQLVAGGLLRALPEDPLGGTFFIGTRERIESTADSLLLPAVRKKRQR